LERLVATVEVTGYVPMFARFRFGSILTCSGFACRPRIVPMSVYHQDPVPRGIRVSETPRRSPRRLRRDRRSTSHRPRLERLEERVVLSPTIFTVNSTGSGTSGSGTSGTLPYVVSQANANTNADGSEIEFDSSVFNSSSPQTITLGATLVLSETAGPEVIDGPGVGIVTISGGGAVRVFEVDSGVTATLSGMTITGGSVGGNGGGLFNSGSLTVDDSKFDANRASRGGGALGNTGHIDLLNSGFADNSAQSTGGAVSDSGSGSISGCTFSSNSAGSWGGGISVNSGALTIINTSIDDNTSGYWGGGLVVKHGAALTADNASLDGNYANAFGGGIEIMGTATITNSTFTSDVAYHNGGGIANNGSLTATGDVFLSDDAQNNDGGGYAGGGYGNLGGGSAVIADCTFSKDSAGYGGGGLASFTAAVTVSDCTFSGNRAASVGGGITLYSGSLTLKLSTLSENSATKGGGLSNNPELRAGGASLTVDGCTLSGNSAAVDGGGLDNWGTATLTDCTVSGNSVGTGGGGIDNESGTVTIGNTIVAQNTATTSGPDALGTFTSLGNNLIGEADGSSGWVGSDRPAPPASRSTPCWRPWPTTAARPRRWPCCRAARRSTRVTTR